MKSIRVLILEDDLQTLSHITQVLAEISQEKDLDLLPTILSEYTQVEKWINPENEHYQILLLDRDCGAGGSFHVVDLDKFDKNCVVGISSVEEYNQALQADGVVQVIRKDYQRLPEFARGLKSILTEHVIPGVLARL